MTVSNIRKTAAAVRRSAVFRNTQRESVFRPTERPPKRRKFSLNFFSEGTNFDRIQL